MIKWLRNFRVYKVVTEGEYIPRFYGKAYMDPLSWRRIAYPVPLNLAVRASRWVWFRLKVPQWGEELLRIAGREQGLRIEYDGKRVFKAKVFLDGKDITKRLTGIDVNMRAGEVPRAQFHYVGPINLQALNAEYIRAVGSIVGVPADVLLNGGEDDDRRD